MAFNNSKVSLNKIELSIESIEAINNNCENKKKKENKKKIQRLLKSRELRKLQPGRPVDIMDSEKFSTALRRKAYFTIQGK